jgi:hypothetical protein
MPMAGRCMPLPQAWLAGRRSGWCMYQNTLSAFFYSDGTPDLEFSFLILAGCFDQVGAHMEALTRSADSRHERQHLRVVTELDRLPSES